MKFWRPLIILYIAMFLTVFAGHIYAWDPVLGGDHGGADWTITVNTEIGGTHTNIGTFRVNPGITANVKAYNGSTYGVVNISANTVDIKGTLTAAGAGYAGGGTNVKGQGPGGGSDPGGAWGAGGASHGGYGDSGNGAGASYVIYGSTFNPSTMGSGGGGGSAGVGGNGGGVIILTALDVQVSGTINANGTNSSSRGGGGSGGSVNITTSTISGSGSITSNGGGCGSDCQGGAGGGGRILIKSATDTVPVTATANEGPTTYSNWFSGDKGSVIFLNTASNNLTIKTSQHWFANPALDGSKFTFNNMLITSNAVLTLYGYYTNNTDGYGVTLNVANLTIDPGSFLSANAAGYAGGATNVVGSGPGAGATGGWGGGGASYANSSGASNGSAISNVIYGSQIMPVSLGSGGGGGSNAEGGNGGGAIKVFANNTISIGVSGGIVANGGISSSRGGGGSGGSIILIADTLTGAGKVTANGGGCGTDCQGGGGSGGRLAFYYSKVNNFSGSYTITGGSGNTGKGGDGTYYSSGYPQLPTNLKQYNLAHNTEITTGGTVSTSTINLDVSMAHGDNMALTPYFEVRQLGTTFSNVATNIGASVAYSGTPVTGTVAVTGLSDQSDYHWQVKVCDVNSNCSQWISYGNNLESQTDFHVFLNQNPNVPSTPGPSYLTDGSWSNNSQPSFSFFVSDPDVNDLVKYRFQISTDNAFNNLVVDYTSALLSQGQKQFSIGQTAAGGTYAIGSPSTQLATGSYFWRVMATDNSNATSNWQTVGSGTSPAFKLDTNTPATNASNVHVAGLTNGSWTNLKPKITWNAGTDNNSGLYGYCLSLAEINPGDAAPQVDPKYSSGRFSDFNDGVAFDFCPYIVSGTSVDLGDTSPSNPLKNIILNGGKEYLLSIRAVNNAGNAYTNTQDPSSIYNLFIFKFDDILPTNVSSISAPGGNFSNLDDVYFNFPTSADIAAYDNESGLLGFQYALNNQTTWIGSTTEPTLGLPYVSIGVTQPFHMDSSQVSSKLKVGYNTIYFRVVDKVGNISSVVRSAAFSFGGNAPSFPDSSEVTVKVKDVGSTKPRNLFTVQWPAAKPAPGKQVDKYYYMVNTPPPQTLETIIDNPATYIPVGATAVVDVPLPNIQHGDNTFYVVPVDNNTDINGNLAPNYSPSNAISTNIVFNSELPDPPTNVAISDASIKEASLWRASLAWDTPSYTGTGGITYTIQRSSDGLTWVTMGTTTGNAYLDTVPKSQKFYWRIGTSDTTTDSKNSPSYSSGVYLTPKGKYMTAASLSSGPDSTKVSTHKATISWSTDRQSDSKIAYGTSSGDYSKTESYNSDSLTSHVVELDNLNPGTVYYYKAKWTDEDGNTGYSDEKTFTTSPQPQVKEPVAKDISIDSALINFTVSNANSIKLFYGTSTNFGGVIELATGTEESAHSIPLVDLQDDSKYYFKINTIDSDGYEYEGDVNSFTTLPRPKISNIKVQQVPNTAQSTLLVTWTSNTFISSIITYVPVDSSAKSRDEVDINMLKGQHKMLLKGLIPNTVYSVLVRGRDKMGNEAISDKYSFTTATDTRPPLIFDVNVEGVNVPAVNSTGQAASSELIVSWTTDEPSTSQVEYGEGSGTDYQQKTQEDTNLTFNHLVTITGLSPSKVYHLRTLSKDAAANLANSSDTVTITPKSTDNALDLVISNLSQAFSFLSKVRTN